jgi:DNA-binding transcriptional MocR family regulator
MLLWVEMPDGRSGMDVFESALRQGIRVAPGAMFSNGTRFNHFLRISCGQRTTPDISRALLTLARIVDERTG